MNTVTKSSAQLIREYGDEIDQTRKSKHTPNPITFEQLSKQTLGTTVTWQELIPLIEAATNVQVCFHAHDGKEYLGRSMQVPKECALDRARWAAKQHPESEPESINVSACAGTLWFGSR